MTMPTCPECGAFRTQSVKRGPLTVQINPAAVYWRGVLHPEFNKRQCAMLHKLCSEEQVSHLGMHIVAAGEDAGPGTTMVQLTKLRQRLPREVVIAPIRGEGYRLEINEGDDR